MAKLRHFLKMKDGIIVQGASLLLILLSLIGCVSQLHPQQPVQAEAEKKPAEEPAKGVMPTFTYRPGE